VGVKVYLIILLAALGLMIGLSVAGSMARWSGPLFEATMGRSGLNVVLVVSFGLFWIMGFALIPLVVHLFVWAQVKIGNGEFFLVKFFAAHERGIVYAVWGVMVLVLAIIYLLDRDEMIKSVQ
jgi:hypothetical protein